MAKDDLIRFRISADRKAAWQACADAAGLSLSEWCRDAAAAEARRVAARGTSERDLRAELAALRGEFGRIGNNLNQLAHRVNAGLALDTAALADALAELDAAREAVSAALRG